MVFNARTKASEKDDPGSSEQAGMRTSPDLHGQNQNRVPATNCQPSTSSPFARTKSAVDPLNGAGQWQRDLKPNASGRTGAVHIGTLCGAR